MTTQLDLIAPEARRPGPEGAGPVRFVERARRALTNIVVLYVLSILVALIISMLLVVLVGGSPWAVIRAFYSGSFSSSYAVSETIASTIPVLIVAIGTLTTVRAGMFNIGQGGQMELGAMCAAFVALRVHGPAPLILVAAIGASVVGGAVWAGIAGVFKFTRNVDVVISTLLLAYVANEILTFAVNHISWLEYSNNGQGEGSYSASLPTKLHLPLFGSPNGFSVNLGLFIGLAVFVLVAVLVQRGTWGFRLRIAGQNQAVGRHLGIRMWAVAGAALVVRDRPVLLLPVCLFFGVIQTGGDFLLSTGVPFYLGQILQALLVLAAVFPAVYKQREAWWRALHRANVLGLPSLDEAAA